MLELYLDIHVVAIFKQLNMLKVGTFIDFIYNSKLLLSLKYVRINIIFIFQHNKHVKCILRNISVIRK